MYRIVKLSGRVHAYEMDIDDSGAIEDIKAFLESGDAIILCNDLEDLEIYSIDMQDIKIVEKD